MSELTQTTTETAPAHSLLHDEPAYARISRDLESIARIWKLHHAQMPQTKIAQELGCHQSTVCRILQEFEDGTTDLAERALRRSAFPAARTVIDLSENGPPEVKLKASRTILGANRLLGDDKSNSVNQIAVVLGVNITAPGQPVIEAKVVETT